MSSIELRDVSVRYGRREVVHGFTESVRSGEWLGLIGPNGAGKSSLLRAVVGIVTIRRGDRGRRHLARRCGRGRAAPRSSPTCRKSR